MTRIFVFIMLILVGVAAFFVLATRGGSGNSSGSSKILHLAIDTDPKTFDPISIDDTNSDGLAHKIYNTLVRFNEKLEIVPDLSEKFSVSPDGKIYSFTLRKGVKFHNGREVKAADAVYSLSRLLSNESKRPQWLMPMVKGSEAYYKDPKSELGIKTVDEYTLTIELTTPFAPFIMHLCTSNCAVIPREAVEDKSKPFARNPVGTGGFILKEWKNSEIVRFVRNDNYFVTRPILDEIQFHIVKDGNTRLEQYFLGELDACAEIPNGRVKESVEKAGKENVFELETLRTNYIGIGMPNGNFKDKADVKPLGTNKLVRQAINYAIDREYLCNTTLEGRGVPAKGILPPGMKGWFTEGRPGWPKDIEKAKSLLAQAGFPEGKGLPVITLLHRNDANTKINAQVIVSDLEKIGIKCELQARDWNSFLEMVEQEPKQMFLLGWVADYPDPDNFLYVLFNSKQFGPLGNHTWYSNPEVDKLTEEARTKVEMKDRILLYRKIEDIILEDSPWICTYHVRNVILLRKNIKGIRDKATALDTGSEFPQVDFAFVDKE
jgi:oligopeptide transport system substrate-binding protein